MRKLGGADPAYVQFSAALAQEMASATYLIFDTQKKQIHGSFMPFYGVNKYMVVSNKKSSVVKISRERVVFTFRFIDDTHMIVTMFDDYQLPFVKAD